VDRLADFVGQDESGLVLNVKIAAQLQHGMAFSAVCVDCDCSQVVLQGQFVIGEYGAAGDAELFFALAIPASITLVLGHSIALFGISALGANRLATIFDPANGSEHFASFVIAQAENLFQAEVSCCCA